MSLKPHGKPNLHLNGVIAGLWSQHYPIPTPWLRSWAKLHSVRIAGSHKAAQNWGSHILVCTEPQRCAVSRKLTLSVFLRATSSSFHILFSLCAEILE